MAAFPQSSGLRWAVGLGVAAALLACVAIGLVVWIVIGLVVSLMIRRRTALPPTPRLIERPENSSERN